ncbi:MAG: glycoside hydrolase family 2 protein [Bacteroidales bacterium]|nr:glycoside hydrolase family 2 protein [Bacteroidales bacterium]
MKTRIFIFSLLVMASLSVFSQQTWPEITDYTKPWTRWWWPGNIVSKEDLTANMEKYRDAGLGGLEITPIYGVRGQENKFIDYLSPEWMSMLIHTLEEAERLDLGIDLANASGWPFGGPWVDSLDACRNINYKTYTLNTGEKLQEKIEFTQKPEIRPLGDIPDKTVILYQTDRKQNAQLYALDQVKLKWPLPVHAVIAYSDSGQVINLSGLVTPERDLDWIAPEGKWTIYALFQGWHGKQVERAGPGGEGDVIDHFSGQAITHYLRHFDTIFSKYDTGKLRGYFNDSYEVDDAAGQADWTNDLFYEFIIRRGYDLRAYLPALFGKDDPDKNMRVLSDYRQTISDLLLEKFTETWTNWAHRQGKITRNQAHGSPGNILDLYAAADIPETEGTDLLNMKFASSAASVTGKQYVACETATWLDEHFLSNLADIKNAADAAFLEGVNHIVYHGTCYSPSDEPWPGFLFYASTEINPANPLWNDIRALNNYITRVQSFLQSGRPDNDILLYYPVSDLYADNSEQLLTHSSGNQSYNDTKFKAGAVLMQEKGYAFDYISDLQIKNTEFYNDFLFTEGNLYKVLLIPQCNYIPIETFSHILRLAYEGAQIIFYGDLPAYVAGWAFKEEKTEFFSQLKARINFSPTNNPQVLKSVYGNGMLIKGNNLEELLSFSGIKRETMADNNLMFVRRQTPAGYTYFVCNKGEKAYDGWISLNISSPAVSIFNPVNGRSGKARLRETKSGMNEVYISLFPGESIILTTNENFTDAEPYPWYDNLAIASEITGTWKLEFVEGGPVPVLASEYSKLSSWTESGEESLKNFSGTVKYSIDFVKPKIKADAWALNLGRVHESASVVLNGEDLGSLTGPDFRIVIDKKQLKKKNNLEIKVSNLMANRIAYMDQNNIQWKKFYNINFAAKYRQNTKDGIFDASSWEPRKSGLLGPVTLTPLKKMQ